MIINPYENINWESVTYLKSNTHLHGRGQDRFERSYNQGQRHFAITWYTPAEITYPLSNWFENIPSDVIGSPASEKVTTNNSVNGHFSSIGSFYSSSGYNWNVDVDGSKLTWQEKFDNIFNNLQFSDGGGITLNHPDELNLDFRIRQLKYDDRVLGIEIYNDSCDWYTSEPYYEGYSKNTYVPFWDKILSRGIRCWGFAVIDWYYENQPAHPHDSWTDKGWSMLLVDTVDEHEALKAYRDGKFFAVILDTGLRFTNISLNGNSLTVSTNKATKLKLVTDKASVEHLGIEKTFILNGSEVYARIEAEDAEGGYIYSNPIMFKNSEDIAKEKKKKLIRNKIIIFD